MNQKQYDEIKLSSYNDEINKIAGVYSNLSKQLKGINRAVSGLSGDYSMSREIINRSIPSLRKNIKAYNSKVLSLKDELVSRAVNKPDLNKTLGQRNDRIKNIGDSLNEHFEKLIERSKDVGAKKI